VDAILRGAAIYVILLLILRLSGKRTLSEMNTFDFVLLLIIGETTQQALIGRDYSVTMALLVIVTIVCLDLLCAHLKQWSPRLEKVLDGVPTLIVANGQCLREPMKRMKVDEQDVLASARQHQGVESLDQIKFAVVEVDGTISVIPQRKSK
jgi:uncharacterized membrane protein YcaP (DUF421 family)